MVCLETELRPFHCFWDCTQILHFGLLFDYECCSVSSKGFLPTVEKTMVVWNSPISSYLVHWFLKHLCSVLPSPTQSHPVCLDSWTWPHSFPCDIVLHNAGPCFIARHSHTSFLPWPRRFIPSGAISLKQGGGNFPPLLTSSISDTFGPERLIFRCHISLLFHVVHRFSS